MRETREKRREERREEIEQQSEERGERTHPQDVDHGSFELFFNARGD